MFKYYINSRKKSILSSIVVFCVLFWVLPVYGIIPNDPDYNLQKQMWDQVNAPLGWSISTGSKDVVVAVIDTGVDINHPDLIDNIWKNEKEIAGNGIDDDGNGYVDDVYGWNFANDNGNVFDSNFQHGQDDYDIYSHGTVIAGLIGAVGNNMIGGTGINWKARIMPLKAFDISGVGTYYNIGQAVDYAVDNGADIISISFAGDSEDAFLKTKLRRAYEKGVLTIVAAGNNSLTRYGDLNEEPMYPVCYDNVGENWLLGVTSVDSQNRLSDFANFGTCVDIAAPGDLIYSTMVRVDYLGNKLFGGPWHGTSFSAPLVAGTAALLKSIKPDLSPSEIINILLSTAHDIEYANPGLAGRVGYGLLDVQKALLKISKSGYAHYLPDRICNAQNNSRIVCHENQFSRNIFISNLGKKIISVDTAKDNAIVALLESGLTILKNDGAYEKNIIFNDNYYYKKVSFFEHEESILIAVFGSKNSNEHIIKVFDINGLLINEIDFFDKNPVDFTMIGGESFASIKNEGQKIIVNHFDFNGRLISKKSGPTAQASKGLISGNFWNHDYQLAFIVFQNGLPVLCVFDLNTGSYYLGNDTKLSGFDLIGLKSKNGDGLEAIFNYSKTSGNYTIFSGKGVFLRSASMSF